LSEHAGSTQLVGFPFTSVDGAAMGDQLAPLFDENIVRYYTPKQQKISHHIGSSK
jgi:hypothetical protein